jgi:hypothetical protein
LFTGSNLRRIGVRKDVDKMLSMRVPTHLNDANPSSTKHVAYHSRGIAINTLPLDSDEPTIDRKRAEADSMRQGSPHQIHRSRHQARPN